MKRFVSHALMLAPLSLLALTAISSQDAALDVRADFPADLSETALEKTIYVDFSLNVYFLAENGSRYITCENDSEDIDYPLASIGEGIYTASLPVDLLAKSDFNFFVHCVVPIAEEEPAESIIYSSGLIRSAGRFNLPSCNYLAIGEANEAELAPIEGFGFFGERTANPGATYATQRVWRLDAETKESAAAFGEANAVGYLENEKWHVIDMTAVANGETRRVYFADIPVSAVSVSFLRIATAENHNYCVYTEVEAKPLEYGVCYSISGDKLNLVEVTGADANLLALVVEAYLTYGEAPSNGSVAATVSNLYNTWFKEKSADSATLKSTKILDYAGYSANGNSYEGLTKKASFSVNEKWNTLCSHAGIDPNTGKERTLAISAAGISKKTLFLLIGGIVGFAVLLAAFAFLMRRRNAAR